MYDSLLEMKEMFKERMFNKGPPERPLNSKFVQFCAVYDTQVSFNDVILHMRVFQVLLSLIIAPGPKRDNTFRRAILSLDFF